MWAHETPQAFLGFDNNEYPGDAALAELRRTFTFAGYWLNPPPGAKQNTWAGKREHPCSRMVLDFSRCSTAAPNTSLSRPRIQPRSAKATRKAQWRARDAKDFRKHRDFSGPGRRRQDDGRPRWLIFRTGFERVNGANFRAGIYCSGMPAKEAKGESVITADDIRQQLGSTPVSFFVYNDACPPSPGCVYRANRSSLPSASGVPYADVWQFAQSPRRRNFTHACSATYNADGNCYPPHEEGAGFILIDLDSARSSDPSSGGVAH